MIVNFFHNLIVTFFLVVFYFQFSDSRYLFLFISIIRNLTNAQGASTGRTVWVSVIIWAIVWYWFLFRLFFRLLFLRLFFCWLFNDRLRICINLLILDFLFILNHFYIVITQVFHSFFK